MRFKVYRHLVWFKIYTSGSMKSTLRLWKEFRISLPKVEVKKYEFQPLSSIKVSDLPNNNFGIKNYAIKKTAYGHWPVYKKIQNTKITTEIKRLDGDLGQFKKDLLEALPDLQPQNVVINKSAGYVNIKGDVVEKVKDVFSKSL